MTQRKIKFRAWLPDKEKMLPPEKLHIDFAYGTLGDLTAFACGLGLILTQYTGVEDRDGKEVYEGDILDMAPELEHSKLYDYVAFDSGCFYLVRAVNCQELSYGLSHAVIVGNIYENPELVNYDPKAKNIPEKCT